MAEKLSWTELRRLLASRAGVSEKEANAFLSAMNAEIVEALKTDKQVKINGLGIFKLQAVAPRKSVNVATGEAITIEGYNKVAFVPEAGVKELIESQQPATAGELPSENDPLQKLGTQAEEIVDILGELGQSPKDEEPAPEVAEVPEIPEVPEEPVQEPEPEPVQEPEPVKEPDPDPVFYVPQSEPVKESEPVFYTPTSSYVHEPEPAKPKKKHHFLRNFLIFLVILLLLLLVGYFFLRDQVCYLIDSYLPDWAKTEQVAVPDTTDSDLSEPVEFNEASEVGEGELTPEQILAEFLEASEEDDFEISGNEQYKDLITIEPMHEASRLAWMAKRFYGAKIYWPYLYDANRDHITNPCLIEVGTPIRVPKLTAAQKDTTNAQTMATLERLRLEGEAACGK